MDFFCAVLAALNAAEAMLCAADWHHTPTPRNAVALAAWLGSTVFWVVRGILPVD